SERGGWWLSTGGGAQGGGGEGGPGTPPPTPPGTGRPTRGGDRRSEEDGDGSTLDRQGGGEHAVLQSGRHTEVDVPAALASREGWTAHAAEHAGSERVRRSGPNQARDPESSATPR